MTPPAQQTEKGFIAWFTYNHVAANLLMLVIILWGLYSLFFQTRTTLAPEFNSHYIAITMPFPGSTPEDVEEGIILKIEQSIEGISGIKEVNSSAHSGLARVRVEIAPEYEVADVMDQIKIKIDGISTFPEDAEKSNIEKLELIFAQVALQIQISGDIDERGRRELADEMRRELLALDKITQVEIYGDRPYEVIIEVPEKTLQKYGLTLSAVANAIRSASVDLPGGTIRTDNGDILLRSKDKAYRQFDFESIVLLSNADGTRLTLGDIATVRDDFQESDGFSYFNGTPSLGVAVMALTDQDMLEISEIAKEYVRNKAPTLPDGVKVGHWADVTFYLKDRLGLMVENLAIGAVLVFMVLLLFMDLKLALWVVAGMIVTFLGTLAVLPLEYINVTLNMISVYGFIVVLGIVVDDAIVIGENIHSTITREGHTEEAVIRGARQVAVPATFGVLTTIVAFLPMVMLEGSMAAFPAAIGYVVIFSLAFSLVESKMILPAHLAQMRLSANRHNTFLGRLQDGCNEHLRNVIFNYYQPLLERCIEYRYLTFAVFLSLLILVVGLIGGGVVRYVMFPDVPGEYIDLTLEMNEGSSRKSIEEATAKIISSANTVEAALKEKYNYDKPVVENLFGYGDDATSANFTMELVKDPEMPINPREVTNAWRDEIGEIAGMKTLRLEDADPMAGPPIAFLLVGSDIDSLTAAAGDLEKELATYDGVFDISNGASSRTDELNITIKPEAEALGLSMMDLGRQVRQAFYGEEAQRIQRGHDEVRVMVRYPEADRRSLATLDNMYIRTPNGDEVPFNSVANVKLEPGYTSIKRIDYKRAVSVTANVDKANADPSLITAELRDKFMPGMLQNYPGVSFELDKGSEEEINMLKSLGTGLLFSLLGIFALLAIPLRSYLQPIIIMGVIPFGFIGAVLGHLFLGLSISNLSMFGILALAGVVVNDSLIMVDFINQQTDKGVDKRTAVIRAGTQRYRAIMLTSLTTFFGLVPILAETSTQAQFIIPMAVSLAFGILFATVITLLLIPCLYMVLEDIGAWRRGESGDPAMPNTSAQL
jgi:multidrug efflux pump subunit AcrB